LAACVSRIVPLPRWVVVPPRIVRHVCTAATKRRVTAVRAARPAARRCGPHRRWPDEPGDALLDFGDATLLPGLIDAHQHLAFDATVDPVAQPDLDDDATLLLRMRLAAQRALAVGVTTIRDLGDRNYLSLALRDWFAAGVDAAADVLEGLAASECVVSMTAAVVPGERAPHPAIARLATIVANHATLYRHGAQIVCSSDAGVGPNKPHDVLPHGVTTFLPMLGLPNGEAIDNVTRLAAEVSGVDDCTGAVEVGKDADVLVAGGNPFDDVAALHDIRAVFARGRRAATSVPGRRAT
jgi:imidazolonepropionase-like amidohydrolase